MHVVGTAGHVDHGKSALVRALTGTDPDRWIEEKLRGMTLDLGFAPLHVDGIDAGIIDVPGHERFIHNMLAGAPGMELLLLVVAANEGPRKQTFEQLSILGYLGVARTIVVLSKCDLVEETELADAFAGVEASLAGTIAAGAPILPVSSVTGEGLASLRATIARALRELPVADALAPAYLPVDRAFTLTGLGTIVTGTLMQGTLAVGDELRLTPAERSLRVRSLQVFGAERERVAAGQRVAVGLAGLERSDVARGAVLAASNLEPRSVLDVEFSPHDSAVATLRRRTPVRAHIGAAEILGTLVFERIPAQGETVRAQLRLRAPTVAFAGARFVVRRPSPKDLIGGGTVARTTAGSAPAAGDDGVAARVLAALAAAGIAGAAAAQVGAVANVAEPLAGETLEGLCTDGRAFRLTRPAAFVAATAVDALLARVVAALETSEAGAPWLLGATSLRLAREFDVAEAELVRALALLADEGRLAHRGGYYATIAFVPRLQPEQGAFFERELVADPAQPYVPVPLDALVAAIRASHVIGISQAFDTLVASGAAVKVGGDVYRGEQIAGVRRAVAEVARREGRIAPSALRDALGTSRKYVVPLLEWLDASGVTVRSGDARVLRQQAAHAEP